MKPAYWGPDDADERLKKKRDAMMAGGSSPDTSHGMVVHETVGHGVIDLPQSAAPSTITWSPTIADAINQIAEQLAQFILTFDYTQYSCVTATQGSEVANRDYVSPTNDIREILLDFYHLGSPGHFRIDLAYASKSTGWTYKGFDGITKEKIAGSVLAFLEDLINP